MKHFEMETGYKKAQSKEDRSVNTEREKRGEDEVQRKRYRLRSNVLSSIDLC